MKKQAYVRLLDEGVEVRRPCSIHILDQSTCIVLAEDYDFEDPYEIWDIYPGGYAHYEEIRGTIILKRFPVLKS